MTLDLLSVSKRITIVESIGSGADGDSLRGQNVHNFPSGALFYVRASHRMYELRKNIDALVVATGLLNVVDGIGSSSVNGRFVACEQYATATLIAGSVAIDGFCLDQSGSFLISYVTLGGTQGFIRAARTDANTVTVTSSSGSDTSLVVVRFLENPE